MDYRNIDSVLKPTSIGRMIASIRHALGYSQKDFAEITYMARGSLAKLENTEKNSEIGKEMLFRLYYTSCRIEENSTDRFICDLANNIKDSIISVIEGS